MHWCSQQRNYPATPLDEYTAADLDHQLTTRKSCAPYCTVSCVHRVAMLDRLREQPEDTIHAMVAAHTAQGGRTPVGVRVLRWTFLAGHPSASCGGSPVGPPAADRLSPVHLRLAIVLARRQWCPDSPHFY